MSHTYPVVMKRGISVFFVCYLEYQILEVCVSVTFLHVIMRTDCPEIVRNCQVLYINYWKYPSVCHTYIFPYICISAHQIVIKLFIANSYQSLHDSAILKSQNSIQNSLKGAEFGDGDWAIAYCRLKHKQHKSEFEKHEQCLPASIQ